jgi:hypothetical protein
MKEQEHVPAGDACACIHLRSSALRGFNHTCTHGLRNFTSPVCTPSINHYHFWSALILLGALRTAKEESAIGTQTLRLLPHTVPLAPIFNAACPTNRRSA